jgi:hypothetical protein
MTGKRASRAAFMLAATTSLVLVAVPTASAHPSHATRRAARGGPGVWTKIAKIDSGFDYPGMFRTADGKLHVLWRKQLLDNNFSFGYTTVALNGTAGSTGTALNDWGTLEDDPVLVQNGNGIRALFKGGIDTGGGFFSRGSVYTLTSAAAGTTWQLPQQSVMQRTALNGGFSATAEQDDTPVAVAGENATLFIHEGLDNSAPAAAADTTVTLPSGDYFNWTAATDSGDHVWVAYFRAFSNPSGQDGFYVQQILPTKGQPMKAPDSTPKSGGDNEPRQSVAFVARPQGGLYVGYCVPGVHGGFNVPCVHVDLWKVGAANPMVVPGTSSSTITRVALASGLAGRISVVTMDPTKETVNAVRTNRAANKFGPARTIKLPNGQINFNNIEAEGTFGRLDIVANLTTSASPNPIFLWHTQILAGLTLTASPAKFANTAPHTVTFTVKDAGDAVQGAKVSCKGLTKTDTTDSSGKATLQFPKNFATGKHVCTAGAPDYNPGKATLTITH